MEFSLIESLYKIDIYGFMILAIAAILFICLSFSKLSYIHMLILTLSASLVGFNVPMVHNVASLVRWLSLFLMFILGIFQKRIRISGGVLLFWGYVLLGLVFLFRANSINWQVQKSFLLLIFALAIPLAYSGETYKGLKYSLLSISLTATIYSLLNFIALPGQLNDAERFSGFSMEAPGFALALGGLLPFTLWALWRANNKAIKIACGLGFFLGVIILIISGQRTGTIGGLISLLPMLLTFLRRKNIGWYALAISLPLLLGYIVLQYAGLERENFLYERYSFNSDLTGRPLIWEKAFSEIGKNPLLGKGMGAAETKISYSFHNSYLEVWFNTGLLGLFFFIASQIYFLYRIWFLRRSSSELEIISLLALALGYMMGFIFICMFESVGAGASNINLILYLFLGVFVSNNNILKKHHLWK
jgi:O-antigen ligase